TENGQTPLAFAAAFNRPEAIRILLQRGADVDLASRVQEPPKPANRGQGNGQPPAPANAQGARGTAPAAAAAPPAGISGGGGQGGQRGAGGGERGAGAQTGRGAPR